MAALDVVSSGEVKLVAVRGVTREFILEAGLHVIVRKDRND
jgi:hypothetical protein